MEILKKYQGFITTFAASAATVFATVAGDYRVGLGVALVLAAVKDAIDKAFDK